MITNEEESGGVVRKRGYDCDATQRGERRNSEEEGL